jgi:hypothetical protein
MSKEFSFKSTPVRGQMPYTFAVIGDLGQTQFSQQTRDSVLANASVHNTQHVVIVGDMSVRREARKKVKYATMQ